MSYRGSSEPRCHAGGGSPQQRGVLLPLGLVPVHVPGEFTVSTVPSFLSQVAVMVSILSLADFVSRFRWDRFFSTSSGE